jgi:hypothetical protein
VLIPTGLLATKNLVARQGEPTQFNSTRIVGKEHILGFSAALAISTTCAALEVLEPELKRAKAGVRLAAKAAVIGRRLGRMNRGAIVTAGYEGEP